MVNISVTVKTHAYLSQHCLILLLFIYLFFYFIYFYINTITLPTSTHNLKVILTRKGSYVPDRLPMSAYASTSRAEGDVFDSRGWHTYIL